MGKKISLNLPVRRIGGLTIVLLVGAGVGCQAGKGSTGFPGLTTTRAQQKILQKVEQDPFPSPGDVGMHEPND